MDGPGSQVGLVIIFVLIYWSDQSINLFLEYSWNYPVGTVLESVSLCIQFTVLGNVFKLICMLPNTPFYDFFDFY